MKPAWRSGYRARGEVVVEVQEATLTFAELNEILADAAAGWARMRDGSTMTRRVVTTLDNRADDELFSLRCWEHGCRVADHVEAKLTLAMAAQLGRSHAVHSGHKIDIEEERT